MSLQRPGVRTMRAILLPLALFGCRPRAGGTTGREMHYTVASVDPADLV